MNQLPQTKPLDQLIGNYLETQKALETKKCRISDNQVVLDHLRSHLLNEKGVKLNLLMITAARTSQAICQYWAEKIHGQVKSSIK